MIVSVPTMSLPAFPNNVSAAPSLAGLTTFDLNASAASVAYVMQMPSTKTIDRVWFRVASNTTTGTTIVKVELAPVSASGIPTTPALVSESNVPIATGAGNYEVTFSSGPVTITQGTLFALVIQHIPGPTSPTPTALRFGIFSDDNHGNGLPYALDTNVHQGAIAPAFGLGVVGSAVPMRHMWPITAATLETFSLISSKNIRGNKITLAGRVRCCGLRFWADLDNPAQVILFAENGTTVLGEVMLNQDIPPDAAAWAQDCLFSSSVTLEPGTYYAVMLATGGSNVGLTSITFPTETWRAGSPFGGADVVYVDASGTPSGSPSTLWGGGGWVFTSGFSENATKQAMISLLIDGIDDGRSEMTHVFMA